MMRSLLDSNVHLALLDADHVDHQRAQEWISGEIQHGWASCALTQNGFVRIISQPRYPSPVSPSEAVERLRRATGTEHHQFWPCSISLLEDHRVNSSHVHGPRQVTDVYLLALAVEHKGRFVTFDRSIPLSAAPGATQEHLVVV
jgi:toxin-antitoxin system PIN domain toxin